MNETIICLEMSMYQVRTTNLYLSLGRVES